MDENNENFRWLYISPDVYVHESAGGQLLLYHTVSGKHMVTSDPELTQIAGEVYEPKNLGVIECRLHDHTSIDFKKAVQEGFIKTLPYKDRKLKPINFLPILNLQNDFSRYENPDDIAHLGRNVCRFLTELNIYLSYENKRTNTEKRDFRNKVSRQILLPEYKNSRLHLHLPDIENVLLQATHSGIKRINLISGNNFFNPINHDHFVKLLANFDFEYHIHAYLDDFYEILAACSGLNVTYDLYTDKFSSNGKIIDLSSPCFAGKHCHFHHLITSKEDFKCYPNFLHMNGQNESIDLIPILTGDNINFFEEHVFISMQDLLDNTVSMHAIFRNQKLNSNFFGILNIYPDKTVSTHGSPCILGNIKNSSLPELVYNELKTNTSWRKTRDLTGCKNCHFCFLCPPISKYEIVSGVYNMCAVSNKTHSK